MKTIRTRSACAWEAFPISFGTPAKLFPQRRLRPAALPGVDRFIGDPIPAQFACIVGLLATLLLWACNLSASEFELRGYYEVMRRAPDSPDAFRKLRELAERMNPGEKPPKITQAVIEAFKKAGGRDPLAEDSLYAEREWKREFTLYVRGKSWLVATYGLDSPPKFRWEIGSAGDGQVFSSGGSETYGGKQGEVRLRPSEPHSLEESGVPILWLFALGPQYLKTVTNGMVWPMHELSGRAEDPNLDKRQKATWETVDWGKQTWLKRIAFQGPQGWTNGYYEVRGWTNEGNLWYPREFYAEMRTQPRSSPAGNFIQPVQRWEFIVTNALETCTRKDLLPTAHPGMSVFDNRVKQPPGFGKGTNQVLKGYQLTAPKWEPSLGKAQARVDGKPYRSRGRWIAAAVGAVVLLGGAVWWLRRRWRRPFTPVRPPADVPGA